MKLIIGIGNHGEKYTNNRHNVGHMVVDKVKNNNVRIKNAIVVKTNIFMNDSGSFVKRVLDSSHLVPSDLYIVHDDLDLPLGSWKMQFAKGPKDNGGINSIEQVLSTKDFWRIRVGIDPTTPRLRGASHGSDFVLGDFLSEERIILDKVIKEICNKLATF